MVDPDDARRFGALTADDVAALDAAAVAAGVPVATLMAAAGWQIARLAWRLVGECPSRVSVVAGRGNNGGDGLVAARLLSGWGCEVRVAVVAEESSMAAWTAALLTPLRSNGTQLHVDPDSEAALSALDGCDLAIDALLGSGLRGAPRPAQAEIITALSQRRTLSVDIPSGMDADSGSIHEATVHAAATCTLAAMKRGLWTDGGRAAAGELFVADIGMPREAWLACSISCPTDVAGGEFVPIPA